MRHLIGLILIICSLFFSARSDCSNITGAVPLYPGSGSVILPGKVEFLFTISPSVTVDGECKFSLKVNGSTVEANLTAKNGYINSTTIQSATYEVQGHGLFEWGFNVDGKDNSFSSSTNYLCVAEYPGIPNITIEDGIITARIDPNKEGYCCSEDGVCNTVVRFFYTNPNMDPDNTLARPLGDVTMDEYSAKMVVPYDLPLGDYKAFAYVCSDMLCGPKSELVDFSVKNAECKIDKFTLTDDKIEWAWTASDPSLCGHENSTFIFLSSAIEGPYERFIAGANSFILPSRYLFGTFYFYVVAGYKTQSTVSVVNQYSLSISSSPSPIELVWPKNQTVFANGTKNVVLFYRSSSWGNCNSSSDMIYSIGDEQSSSQSCSVGLKDQSDKIMMYANNSHGMSEPTEFFYTICDEGTPSGNMTITVNEDAQGVKVSWTPDQEVKFCDKLAGPRGYSVEISAGTFSMLKWIPATSSREASFPALRKGVYTVTVKEFIGTQEPGIATTEVNVTRNNEGSNICEGKFRIDSLEYTRVDDGDTYPRPVKLSWEKTWDSVKLLSWCTYTGFNIFVNDYLVETLTSISDSSYTVPSQYLSLTDKTKITLVVFTENSTVSKSVTVDTSDNSPVDFVKLQQPSHASTIDAAEVQYSWESLGKNYEYEFYFGRDPDDLKLVSTTTSTSLKQDGFFGTAYWTVRGCIDASKILDTSEHIRFCGGLSTPYTIYGCTHTDTEQADASITWTNPVIMKWSSTPFEQNCSESSGIHNEYYYNISVGDKTYKLLPSMTSYTLNDVEPGGDIEIQFSKCVGEKCTLVKTETHAVERTNETTASVEVTDSDPSNTIVSIGTTISWSVVWGRSCNDATGCESRVWFGDNDSAQVINIVPSGDTDAETAYSYSYVLTDESYLVERTGSFFVVVDNGYYQNLTKYHIEQTMCRPNPPSAPSLIYPPNYIQGGYSLTFSFAQLMQWGDCQFGSREDNFYHASFFNVVNEESKVERVIRANETTTDETDGVTVDVTLENDCTYKWVVTATNYFHLTGGSTKDRYYTSCQIVPPDEPLWRGEWKDHAFYFVKSSSSSSVSQSSSVAPVSSSASTPSVSSSSSVASASSSSSSLSSSSSTSSSGNEHGRRGDSSDSASSFASSSASSSVEPAEVSPHGFLFTEQDFLLGSKGVRCAHASNDTKFACVHLGEFNDLNEFSCKYELVTVTDTSPLRVKPSDFGLKNFEKNSMIYIYIVVGNGAASSYSKVLALRTMNRTCDEVPCVKNQGECNTMTVVCDCFAGFNGTYCEQDLVWENTVKIIIGVSVGGFVLLAAIAVIVTIVVVKFYRKHKALMMKPPDFEALRTPPIKMPSYGPDVDAPSNLSILEAALLAPTGFQMIWDLLHHTSATEIDIMAKALVYAYQRHNKGLELQLFLIMCEIAESQTSTVLFRANSPATRAFKFYSKMYALPYLYNSLAILLQTLIRDVDDMEEEKGTTGDSDVQMPKLGTDSNDDNACSDENINTLKLQLTCQKFFIQILRSDKKCPGELKHICAFLRDQLQQRFPDFVFKGMGAFVFLRFYNTAITVPETYGLLPSAPRPSVRKQLLLVSKVLQNLANGVQFGEKEPNMECMNSFLQSRRPAYEEFLTRLCDNTVPLSEPVPISDDSYRAALATILNQFFIIMRSDPDYLSHLDCVPPDLAELIRNSLKKDKKKKDDPAAASLLETTEIPSTPVADIPPPPVDPPTTTTTTTTL